MNSILVCEQCGSSDVDGQAWVNINSLKFQDWMNEDKNFCNQCQEYVEVIEKTPEEIKATLELTNLKL